MSAFIHEDESFNKVLATLDFYPHLREAGNIPCIREDLVGFVERLREWNYRSVDYRYRETNERIPYKPAFARPLSPIALYKLLSSIEYQSCEVKEWYGSPEEQALTKIQNHIAADVVTATSEYQQASWG